MKKILLYTVSAIALILLGIFIADTRVANIAQSAVKATTSRVIEVIADAASVDTRSLVLAENPALLKRIAQGGAFGGDFSRPAAMNMFGRTPEAIADVRAKTRVIEVGPRSYLIRMPIVNAAFFDTDEGIVLVDTGMGPAGPAIMEAIRSVSDKPIHTIIYTHGHVDHAYGTWAILEAGETPQIIAQEQLLDRFNRYLRIPGSLAKYMNQPEQQLPHEKTDLVWPTRTFTNRLELKIGGELFVLQHHRGETDDQLYVWVPGRQALASADYYQGFLPNAGNGKRYQRHVEEWAVALKEMAALEPKILLPAHGEAITDPATIIENFSVLAETLQYIVDYTLEGLNAGKRKDLIYDAIQLPEHLTTHPSLAVKYVGVADISKMVLKQYTGWWDDIPSHWTPASMADQGNMIIALGGGNIPALTTYGKELIDDDIRLASHLADWLFYARPDNAEVQQLVSEVYRARIMDSKTNTMEMLTYLDQMTAARQRARNQ
jgi:alkyl sulfatase BDS1-like metallo-beta-lactamase superfamily hydrolase